MSAPEHEDSERLAAVYRELADVQGDLSAALDGALDMLAMLHEPKPALGSVGFQREVIATVVAKVRLAQNSIASILHDGDDGEPDDEDDDDDAPEVPS